MFRAVFRATPTPRCAPPRQSPASWKQAWQRSTIMSSSSEISRVSTRHFGIFRRIQGVPRQTTKQWAASRVAAMLRATRRSFQSSTRWGNSQTNSGAQEKLSLSARLRKLSKEYGWATVGVYFGLSVLDFPFCFLLVRIVGTDKIGELEHWVVSNAAKVIPQSVQDSWSDFRARFKKAEKEHLPEDVSEHVEMVGWGVEEADRHNRAEASLGTQLALAYAIHKSFIFIRVPLTAAVTPKVVKVLRSWGWKVGKRT